MSYQDRINQEIPADVHMISGCHDVQTSADANITNFGLPDPAGRQGGACTAAILQVLYNKDGGGPQDCANMSWVEVLRRMRDNLAAKDYEQVPQLSSSRMIDVHSPMQIVQPGGTKRAVLIGINYVGASSGVLSGCHNDVYNISKYLRRCQGFEKHNMTVLCDDGQNHMPTRANIEQAFQQIVRESEPGDTVWIHYSGHGGRIEDQDGDEDDGYDETLIPVDYERAGQIRDDDLLKYLVKPMAQGVLMTCLMDCCHSGTVLDLPYRFVADGDHEQMERNDNFDMGHLMSAVLGNAGDVAAVASIAAAAATAAGIDADDCCVIL